MRCIRYLDGATRSNEVIEIDPNLYVPAGNEKVIEFPIELGQNPEDYELQLDDSLLYLPEGPDPSMFPQVDEFITAVFNDELWTNYPALRPARPNLSMTRNELKQNLYQPEVIATTWEDIQIGLVAQVGQSGADAIVAMVQGYAATFNIPGIVPEV